MRQSHRYFCQTDGGQWNIKVIVIHRLEGLSIVQAVNSNLIGCLGNDGHTYALVADCELYDKLQD